MLLEALGENPFSCPVQFLEASCIPGGVGGLCLHSPVGLLNLPSHLSNLCICYQRTPLIHLPSLPLIRHFGIPSNPISY